MTLAMPRKNGEKEEGFKRLEKSIFKTLIVNDSRLRPYIELFEFAPENIVQQQLGTLLGIFEIKDESEDSAYIVNFLTSVAKKEYFANPKRPVFESFESALNKINLALSELAKNGNVSWLGKLDATVCVLEKNNLHFSVAGNAKVLLLRNQTLTDISEGLASEEEEPYPLKTFVNVSSGRLEKDDKLIITTEDIFHIFSLTEIKKSSLHFAREKFAQFVKTALVNELEIAGTIIVDIYESPEPAEVPEKEKEAKKKKEALNAFSEKTFEEALAASKPAAAEPQNIEASKEFVDQKTGHIYVQGEYEKPADARKMDYFTFYAKEKIGDFFFWAKINVLKKNYLKIKKIPSFLKETSINFWLKIKEKRQLRKLEKKGKIPPVSAQPAAPEILSPKEKEEIFPRFSALKESVAKKPAKLLSYFLPSFSKMKDSISRMTYQQKIFAALILTAIFVIPLFWIRSQNEKPIPLPPEPLVVTKSQILSQDKNINLETQVAVLYSQENIADLVILNDQLFIVTKDRVIRLKDNQETEEFQLPSNFGEIVIAEPMEDLKLIFLLTDQKKIVSFGPVSHDFKENKIEITADASAIKGLATYLTYLYLIDAQNKQIYRYPRAEGGFGAKISWLKDDVDLSQVTDAAIDENVYLATSSTILKLFRGAKQDWVPEQSATPINFSKIFTDSQTSNIYALDGVYGRIIKFTKTGELLSQYYNKALEKSQDFTVDEKNGKAYVVTADGKLVSLGL